MPSLIWILGYAVLASGLWAASAFVFRLRHTGRFIVTVAVPAVLACALVWTDYFASNDWPGEWAILFAVASVMIGGFVAICILPVWYVFEAWFGWRAL